MQKLKARFRVINFIFYILLISCSIFVILDTFVIPHKSNLTSNSNKNEEILNNNDMDDSSEENEEDDINNSSVATITDNSYEDENISIKITTERANDTTYYVADISLSDSKYLKTALANDTYGRNIKETTSVMAQNNNAIFAINGDYYGFRDYGYVIRNGVLYRETANEDNDALVIDNDGNFSIVNESEVTANELLNEGAWQVLSFGPALIEEGEVVVGKNDEVSQAKTSNPRTAIGQVDELHYIVIVADGRTSESEGLSLYELAQVMKEYNCTTAYNLDGGGSSTMYFNGEVINNPTSGGSIGERSVSDIVYIGY
ncbi:MULTISPECIES: phosphodiester glycosidase family protein [Clostridia]|uniref:Phosphodiester glycosidase family protein n=1 Tax=Clostridium saudiense TaxID=1414720 RepID=A0ABS2FJT1_9CLOT|nr:MULTISPECIES: phosphodiester glycosidase family protein [Clostridiaceae]MBM6820759.1 phosphodiester glycosidase family protein [Clostridium saudiense]